jgi:hypothetical protein
MPVNEPECRNRLPVKRLSPEIQRHQPLGKAPFSGFESVDAAPRAPTGRSGLAAANPATVPANSLPSVVHLAWSAGLPWMPPRRAHRALGAREALRKSVAKRPWSDAS